MGYLQPGFGWHTLADFLKRLDEELAAEEAKELPAPVVESAAAEPATPRPTERELREMDVLPTFNIADRRTAVLAHLNETLLPPGSGLEFVFEPVPAERKYVRYEEPRPGWLERLLRRLFG